MDRSHAVAIPKLTNRPNTCTGGIGVNASDRNPTTVVSEVKSIGENSSSIRMQYCGTHVFVSLVPLMK